MKVKRGSAAIGILAVGLVTGASGETRAHSTDPLDWMIQHVCADSADKPVPADPYDGCPDGTHERRLKIGDPMPYLRHDLPGRNGDHPHGYQRNDAYPLIDLHYGGVISANDFDFDYREPYGRFHPGDGDGGDIYRVWNDYATGGTTRDGAGYSQSFFGPECRPFGGWVFFPVSFLKELRPGAEGKGIFPIRGSYWEQRGDPWPGQCEPGRGFSTTTLTTWTFEQAHPFGGVNGAKRKTIDAIVSTHGFPLPPESIRSFGLERFYFTDLYGLTRWEAWHPKSMNLALQKDCGETTEMTYQGMDFVLTGCREWSQTELNDPPRSRFPWPYPEINLLENWHFDEKDPAPWRREGSDEAGAYLDWSLWVSGTKPDTRFTRGVGGVKYLQIACRGDCRPEAAIFQDIPIERLRGARRFDYGFSGVSAGAGVGSLAVTLSLRDKQGRVLWSDSFDASVADEYQGKRAEDSVYLASSVFLRAAPAISMDDYRDAANLRLTLSPKTPAPLDIMDAWVMPR
jgi:hypothetical protein